MERISNVHAGRHPRSPLVSRQGPGSRRGSGSHRGSALASALLVTAALLPAAILALPGQAEAQTDFYNLDKDRPFRVEDAFTGKHRGLELKGAPVSLLRRPGGDWDLAPGLELKAGLLPGFEASLGLHPRLERRGTGGDGPVERRWDAGSAELSGLLNLWGEGPRLPAAALRLTGHLGLASGAEGSGGPGAAPGEDREAYAELRGILTRGVAGPLRLHLNGGLLAGSDAESAWGGAALDWVLPFQHTLLMAEGWVTTPPESENGSAENRVHLGVGARTQLSPALVLDAGVGRDLAGPADGSWSLTLGLTWEFGLRGWHGGTAAAGPRAAPPSRTALETPGAMRAPTLQRVAHPFQRVAEHNLAFRNGFGDVDRLFNAFDFGHGILYETLWARPDAPTSLLEEEIYARLVEDILPSGPRLPMPEASFMPTYARMAPLAKEMFEWAHILHRQSYDIVADPNLSEEEKDQAMAELLAHYEASDLAFTSVPKGMEVMDGQYFSTAFREAYPRFNGLIWAYHWLQVAVYEPFLVYDDPADQRAAVQATLARFWQMLAAPPEALPSEMPMTPVVAPAFTERYPRMAAVFDNLHMMHDVISDLLVSDQVAREDVASEIYRQAALFMDAELFGTSDEAWISMARSHGVDAQGGPGTGWLPPVPTRGAAGHGGHGGHDGHDGHDGHGGNDGHDDHDGR